MVLYTHTHSIVLIEEKRIDSIYSEFILIAVYVFTKIIKKLILKEYRFLFSKQKDLLNKDKFKIRNEVFEGIKVSRFNQFVY